ncbi:hypothetical protein CFN78_10030 [Amycolatopsis antarctica]|uniref:DUF3558 domain-containing protein n=1 Tax=Amycolatopsis antarctica TaxID=1854586 RepID=A0A263D4B1_9PSEU|nr:DUF3558 family protein [Amycolatopsis antarctica]OZM73201.1 hypothetical protein CFN78_10030 [Amycolatopsis antarctica]
MNRRHLITVACALASTSLLASCASSIAGTAQPAAGAPSAPPAQPARSDPCTLLTPEQATGLGYVEKGTFTDGDPGALLPPTCRWEAADTMGDVNSVSIALSTDIALEEYYDSAQPTGEKEIGGLRWESYEDPIAGDNGCDLATKIGRTSFVQVASLDFGDEPNACASVEAVAPQVAAALPGGSPAPPPVNPDAVPATPLSGLEPCDLVPLEKLEAMQYKAQGRKTGQGRSGTNTPPGCEWESNDPDARLLYLALFLDEAAEDIAYDEQEVEKFDTGGRTWGVFKEVDNPDFAKISCSLILPYGPKSAVKITSGHSVDPAKTCDGGKGAAEALTPALPPA